MSDDASSTLSTLSDSELGDEKLKKKLQNSVRWKRWWLKNRDKYNERRRLAAQLRSAKTKAERAKASGASKDQEQRSTKRQKRAPTKAASRTSQKTKNNLEINNDANGIQQMAGSLPLATVAPLINQRLPTLPTGMVPSFAASLIQPQGPAMFPSMNMAPIQWKPSTTPPPSVPTPTMSFPQMVYASPNGSLIGHFSPHVYQPSFQAAPQPRFTGIAGGSHPAFLQMQPNFMTLQSNLAPGISINHH